MNTESTNASGLSPPSVAIIVPTMDRSANLASTLPGLLGQDYRDYSVVIFDHGSRDGLDAVLEAHTGGRLKLVRLPRPRYWSFACAGNAALRYSASELVFVIGADTEFADSGHLLRIVQSYQESEDVDYEWWRRWHQSMGESPIQLPGPAPQIDCHYRRVYCHTLGGVMLVERRALLAIGGFNEFFTDWGYEDTDLLARLELAGFGHIAFDGMLHRQNDHDEHLNLNYRIRDRQLSWQRNRQLSNAFIARVGVVAPFVSRPGRRPWVEIDGVRYAGDQAPQQDWRIQTRHQLLLRLRFQRLRNRLEKQLRPAR